MTTPTPYEPSAHPGGYPTAPPWAPPRPEPERPAQPPPYEPYQRLMVAYPEEMFNASRPRPPSWVPVVVLTFFFGVFGAFSAARRAAEARRGANDRHPYWIAFGTTLAAGVALTGVALSLTLPQYFELREEAVTKAVSSGIVGSSAAVAASVCEPAGDRGSDGLRQYTCIVTTTDGRSTTVAVRADSRGRWTKIQ